MAPDLFLVSGLRHMSRGTEHATRQKMASVSPRALWHRACHLSEKGSGVATCPKAHCVPLTWRGLWCCHVARGTEPVTRQEKALDSPRDSWLQAQPRRREALASPHGRGTGTTARQGFGTGTCPVAPDPPPGAGGL
jgi:hypothetical protein